MAQDANGGDREVVKTWKGLVRGGAPVFVLVVRVLLGILNVLGHLMVTQGRRVRNEAREGQARRGSRGGTFKRLFCRTRGGPR